MSEKINPKVGEFWKSRAGKKQKILKNDTSGLSGPRPWVILVEDCESGDLHRLNSEGRSDPYENTHCDLISQWIEPPPKVRAWLVKNSGHQGEWSLSFFEDLPDLSYAAYSRRAPWLDEK